MPKLNSSRLRRTQTEAKCRCNQSFYLAGVTLLLDSPEPAPGPLPWSDGELSPVGAFFLLFLFFFFLDGCLSAVVPFALGSPGAPAVGAGPSEVGGDPLAGESWARSAGVEATRAKASRLARRVILAGVLFIWERRG